MEFDIQKKNSSIIKVIGVGGGGGNAVAHMYKQGIIGVDFAICNTDAQAMDHSEIPVKISLGPHLTEGRGAGSKPEVGKEACIESIDEVRTFLSDGTKMLFITAGMGGGTGTGAAPIIAKAAKEMDILTVAIVTLPFKFEGMRRNKQALEGLAQLKKNVDSILVVSNDKVKEIHGNLELSKAFSQADNILSTAAKGIAEIITVIGKINVDFEDVNTVMKDSGVAIMGHAVAEGEDRARKSIEASLNSPLLEDNDIRGAKFILLNITSGTKEITMDEVSEITNYTGFREGNNGRQPVADRKVVKVGLDEDHLGKITYSTPSQPIFDDIPASQNVFDFEEDDIKTTIETMGVKDVSYESEVMSNEDALIRAEQRRKEQEMEATRRELARKNSSIPLDSPKVVADMETVPAYARRNVKLDDVKASRDINRSRYTVSMDDENPIISNGNSFLHDNVD